LYIRKGRREDFKRSWQLLKSSQSVDKATALPQGSAGALAEEEAQTPAKTAKPTALGGVVAAASAGTGLSSKGVSPAPEAGSSGNGGSGNGRGKAAARAAAKDEAKEGKNPVAKVEGTPAKRIQTPNTKRGSGKKAKTEFDVKVDEAEATKNLYMIVSGKASLLSHNIKANKSWAWGRSEDISGKLESLMASVQGIVNSAGEIAIAYVSGCSVQNLVETYGQKDVHDALIHLVHDLSKVCEALRAHVDKLVSMHTIMTSNA
jgi:hypothetical protein